jgi:hypothetical protein
VIDQMRYAALHVGAIDAQSVLSRDSVAAMQRVQRAAGSMCESIGISWMLDDAGNGERLVKHGGATNGQLASFEMIPSKGFAVTVLTNADSGRETRQTIADRAQQHFLGFGKPAPRAADARGVDLTEYAGTYHATMEHLDVTIDDNRLCIAGTPPPRFVVDPQLRPLPRPPAMLAFYGQDQGVVLSGARRGERVEFLRDAAGQIAWLRWDGRIARRQTQID